MTPNELKMDHEDGLHSTPHPRNEFCPYCDIDKSVESAEEEYEELMRMGW